MKVIMRITVKTTTIAMMPKGVENKMNGRKNINMVAKPGISNSSSSTGQTTIAGTSKIRLFLLSSK